MKWITLLLLVLQTVASVMTIRFATVRPVPLSNEKAAREELHRSPVRFLNTTVVALAEVFKFLASFVALWGETGFSQPMRTLVRLRSSLFSNPVDTLKLGVPAALYTLQNNLVFVALANLSGAVYQVTYQMKILTTAVLSVLILGRPLSTSKWASLLLLTLGVILIQLATLKAPPQAVESRALMSVDLQTSSSSSVAAGDLSFSRFSLAFPAAAAEREANVKTGGEREVAAGENPAEEQEEKSGTRQPEKGGHVSGTGDMATGLAAVFAACLTSAFAGVYLEKLLQHAPVSIWVRNIQLAVFGMVFGFAAVYWNDGGRIRSGGFFQGYTPLVWVVLLLQGVGGLIVAAVLKYADNILKCFGNASSILLSCLLSWWLLGDYCPTPLFCLGAILVVIATCAYTVNVSKLLEVIGGKKATVTYPIYYKGPTGRSVSEYARVSTQAVDEADDEETARKKDCVRH